MTVTHGLQVENLRQVTTECRQWHWRSHACVHLISKRIIGGAHIYAD